MGTDAEYMRSYRATPNGKRADARVRWIRKRLVATLCSRHADEVEELRRELGVEFDRRWPKP